jgi:hypothetical protein
LEKLKNSKLRKFPANRTHPQKSKEETLAKLSKVRMTKRCWIWQLTRREMAKPFNLSNRVFLRRLGKTRLSYRERKENQFGSSTDGYISQWVPRQC